MNMPRHESDIFGEHAEGSDAETDPGESPEYYEPISSADDFNSDNNKLCSDEDGEDYNSNFHNLPNGHIHEAESEISSLNLIGDCGLEEDEGQEMTRERSDSAIQRAFMDDEMRRNAPLPTENAMRVIEAMRGVTFGGTAPDWVRSVPEDQWIDQLRVLRQSQIHNNEQFNSFLSAARADLGQL